MKRSRAQYIIAVIGLGWFALTLYLLPWESIACNYDVVNEVISPDGQMKVVTFVRKPWLETDFSTQASLIRVGEGVPRDLGNIFQAWPTGHPDLGLHGELKLGVNWESNRDLIVTYDNSAGVGFAVCNYDRIRIQYKQQQ